MTRVRTTSGDYIPINYQEGDIVFHRLTGKKVIVDTLYHKLNKVTVTDGEGNRYSDAALSYRLETE